MCQFVGEYMAHIFTISLFILIYASSKAFRKFYKQSDKKFSSRQIYKISNQNDENFLLHHLPKKELK